MPLQKPHPFAISIWYGANIPDKIPNSWKCENPMLIWYLFNKCGWLGSYPSLLVSQTPSLGSDTSPPQPLGDAVVIPMITACIANNNYFLYVFFIFCTLYLLLFLIVLYRFNCIIKLLSEKFLFPVSLFYFVQWTLSP